MRAVAREQAASPFGSNETTGRATRRTRLSRGNHPHRHQIMVQIPVDICGNAVGLLGFANASCQGGAAALLDSFNS